MKLLPGYGEANLADLVDEQVVIVGKSMDIGCFRYRDVNYPWRSSATDMEDSSGWFGIMVFVEGAIGNAKALNLEYIHHYEAIPGGLASSIIQSTMAAPHQPLLLAAAENTVAMIPAARQVDQNDDGDFIDRVENAWNKAVGFATTVAGYASTAAKIASIVL